MRPLDPIGLPLAGASVIEASAGTGKTYTITSLFLRLLIEQGLSVGEILVVTYTRAATAELRDRIRARLAAALAWAKGQGAEDFVAQLCARGQPAPSRSDVQTRIERALADIDEAPVLTIHGFCQRALREHAFESGGAFELKLRPHVAPAVDEIVHDYTTRALFDRAPAETRCLLDEAEPLHLLARKLQGAGAPRLIPDPGEAAALELAPWQQARSACQQLWPAERAAITGLIAALKGVGEKRADSLPDKLEALLETAQPGFSAAANQGFIHFFTRSGVLEKARGAPPSHPFFDAMERWLACDQAWLQAQADLKLAFRRRFADHFGEALEQRCREDNVRTFDALLIELDRALAGASAGALLRALRGRYRAALVDEFQDTDPTQYRIFRRLFVEGGLPLLMIGDPKQAIYAFRGADVLAYMRARDDARGQVFTLDVNRRSDPALIQALNQLYGRVQQPFLTEGIDYHPVHPPDGMSDRLAGGVPRGALDIALCSTGAGRGETTRRVARCLAEDILQLLASDALRLDDDTDTARPKRRPLVPSDIAVLCRTNADALEVQQALSDRGIPSVMSGDASVFDTEDVAHVERALMALAHPADARALRAFLSSIYGGCSAAALLALETDDAKWDDHRARVSALHQRFVEDGFVPAMRGLLTAYEVEQRLLSRPDGTRRLTNLTHLCELLAEAAIGERLGPLGLLRWLQLARGDESVRAELVAEAHELRLESNDDAVQLTTVHKSKGLQYPLVYCPFLYRGTLLNQQDKQFVRFHDEHGGLVLDLGGPERERSRELAAHEARGEALRLLYVALTRAKHRVCLVLADDPELTTSAPIYTLFGGGAAVPEAKLKLGELRAPLERLVQESGGRISLRELPAPTASRFSAPRAPARLEARRARRSLDLNYRTGSFTSLVTSRARPAASDDPADYDAEPAPAPAPARPSPLTLDAFPRGAAAGKLIHEVLEHCDFTDPASLDQVVAQVLGSEAHAQQRRTMLTQGLREALATPLPPLDLTLERVPRPARLNEMEFLFPVTDALSPQRLRQAFVEHGAPPALPEYGRALSLLSFERLRGFLRGFIDLVFAHDGRFYVVDYKSNHLGPMPSDYGPSSLAQAMAEHHYFLQYHLYTVALHRYLAQRLPGYDYAHHFGGVFYLFLRGMAPAHPAGSGVFFDRPAQALVDALDALFGRPPARLP